MEERGFEEIPSLEVNRVAEERRHIYEFGLRICDMNSSTNHQRDESWDHCEQKNWRGWEIEGSSNEPKFL